MGLVNPPQIRGPAGSDEFIRMMRLFSPELSMPMTSPGEIGAPVPEVLPGPGQETASSFAPQVILPLDVARMLGLDIQPLPETVTQKLPLNDPEPMVMARAELFSADDGNDQILYLRILPDPSAAATDGETPVEKMILPMRLRTVEHRGDRITADADLLTAAGEDVSIRLQLELAGIRNGIQEMASYRPQYPDTMPSSATVNGKLSLPRLLTNLDVKLLVIEQVEAENNLTPKAVLPGPADMPVRGAGIKTLPTGTLPETTSREVYMPVPGPDGSGSMSARDQDAFRAGIGPDGKTSTAAMTAKPIVAGENVSLAPKQPGFDQILAGATGTMSQAQTMSTEPLADTGAGEIRFFDLEHQIDHLKHNPGQKIRIQLVPAKLGKMELAITSHRGLVTVHLTLDSLQAKQAVERSLGHLERHLAASGIRVDSLQVHVTPPPRSAMFAQQQDHQAGGWHARQQGGDHYRHPHDPRRWPQFSLSGPSFEQTMVNCLA